MSEFTHARCGGVLVEIPAPDWSRLGGRGWVGDSLFVRCQNCHRPGEVARGPEENDPSALVEGSLQVPL